MKKLKVKLLKGDSSDIVNSNINSLKEAGYSHNHATHFAMRHAKKKTKKIVAKMANMGSEQVKLKGY